MFAPSELHFGDIIASSSHFRSRDFPGASTGIHLPRNNIFNFPLAFRSANECNARLTGKRDFEPLLASGSPPLDATRLWGAERFQYAL